MINLISNAVKFTDEGAVTCRVRRVDHQIEVAIQDTGIGIAAEDAELVFDKFRQVGDILTDKPVGTGLGLPICKEIINHHGGEIRVSSEIGHGSTFSFVLNILASGTIDVDNPHFKTVALDDLLSQLQSHMQNGGLDLGDDHKNILVVDDDPSIRELLRQELQAAGYTVFEAKDGAEVLEQVERNQPDLIILDVMMPKINGFDVVAMLKTNINMMNLPIIILSIVEDHERGYRLGVDRYLTKPINDNLLLHEIDGLLSRQSTTKRVMLVEDGTDTTTEIAKLLEARDYEVITISNSQQLIPEAIVAKPDLVVANAQDPAKNKILQSLRFEKDLEDVYILFYQ